VELPHLPEHDDAPTAGTTSRRTKALVLAVIVALAIVVLLHLSGVVGPG
jgi:hypothetical protein